MHIILTMIGSAILSLLGLAVPVACTCSFIFDWYIGYKILLYMLAFGEFLLLWVEITCRALEDAEE